MVRIVANGEEKRISIYNASQTRQNTREYKVTAGEIKYEEGIEDGSIHPY